MQLIGAATPNVPNQAPMPQASKQLLNPCPIPPMYIIVALLPGCQSSILSSNEWHNDMNPAFISTIMAPNNFLYNMVKVFANMCHALTPSFL